MNQRSDRGQAEQGQEPESDSLEWTLETMATTADSIAEMLGELAARDEMSFWMANLTTMYTVRDLIELGRALSVEPQATEVEASGQAVISRLPFTAQERLGMAERIAGREADAWYESATDEDIVLIDRWRRWIDKWFDDEHLDLPDNQGKHLIEALTKFSEACDTLEAAQS